MKRLFLLLLIVFATTVSAMAQIDSEEEPIPPPRKSFGPKFGGGAGFTQNLVFLDIGPINQILTANKFAPFNGNGLFMMGGQGYGYILLVPNLRVGGMGGSGTRTSTSYSLADHTRRDLELSAGFGGATIDYVFPVFPRFDIATGIFLGFGGMSFTLRRDDNTQKLWGTEWQQLGGNDSVYNVTTKLSGSFFVVQPNVNFEFAVLRWLGLRVGVGYMGMFGNNWKVDDNYDLLGVPDNVSAKGWMINGGIFLGTFIY